jgi:hypothetical protein
MNLKGQKKPMGKAKRFPQDVAFSNYIRERDKWTCQRCGTWYDKTDSRQRMALHCSHVIGRSNWRVRCEPSNAMAICYGCHQIIGSDMYAHQKVWRKKFSYYQRNKIKNLALIKNFKTRDVKNSETTKKFKELYAKECEKNNTLP